MLAITNKELIMLEKAAHEFSRKVLFPERENNDKFPFGPFFQSTFEKAFDLDFFHTILPESIGGLGHGMTALCVLLESICTEDSSLGGIIFTHSAAMNLMLATGSQKELGPIMAKKNINDVLIAIPVFNNPSETNHLPEAVPDGETYCLSGPVDYLTLGGIAGHAIVAAKTKNKTGYSFFLVDLSQAGIRKSDPVLSLGLRACPSVDTRFEKVPARLIGEEGKGPDYFNKMADRMHTAAAAMSLGIMKGSFKEALDYGKKRDQGGRKIIQWSEMKMILGNMAVQIKVSDMIVTQSCNAVDNRDKDWEAGSRAAALHVQSLACDLTTDGVQAMGGVGYMKDFGQEKRFRDAKQLQALLGMCPVKKIRYLEKMI
ncbi:MAG: acyl-CoA dehydrogenase family protein [Proteobacteria bacterium]|nr:acyl-CoA dehydrogenase family protein [Pseudomonadota bacterium]